MKASFTSESVTEGHPDKICDRISDTILDEHIKVDSFSRVACETLISGNTVVVAGEITSSHRVNYEEVVRRVLKDVGYDAQEKGIDWKDCEVITMIRAQSPDIAMGVIKGDDIGAGDQGMMFGFACDETEIIADKIFMPLPIYLAHKLIKKLDEVRKSGADFLKPDGKSQVTIEYENEKPVAVSSTVISAQHSPDVDMKNLKDFIVEEVIKKVIPKSFLKSTKFFVNPTGRFVIGGPSGDSGLTGRKIIVDTYGGYARHGGGCFSGKDPTKVDRSGAYMARYIAKNIVAAGIAKKCEVSLAYVIGVPEPVHISVETFGTGNNEKLAKIIRELFPLKPKGIIEYLKLRRPIFAKTSVYGHFGRDEEEFSWEKLEMVDALKSSL